MEIPAILAVLAVGFLIYRGWRSPQPSSKGGTLLDLLTRKQMKRVAVADANTVLLGQQRDLRVQILLRSRNQQLRQQVLDAELRHAQQVRQIHNLRDENEALRKRVSLLEFDLACPDRAAD